MTSPVTVMTALVENQEGAQTTHPGQAKSPPPTEPSQDINKVKEMMEMQSTSMDEKVAQLTQSSEKSTCQSYK